MATGNTKKASDWLYASVIVFILGLIFAHITNLRKNHDPTLVLNALVEKGDALVLGDWTPRYIAQNQDNVPQNLAPSLSPLSLPDRAATTRLVQERADNTDIALSHDLTPQELAWLDSAAKIEKNHANGKPDTRVEFIAPNLQMSRATLHFNNAKVNTRTGKGNFLLASIDIEELRKNPNFTVIFKITETPWFGPTQIPMVLARPSVSEKILSMRYLATLGEQMIDMFTFGCAILFFVMLLTFERTPGMLMLGAYCTARLLRILVGNLINAQGDSQELAISVLEPLHFGLDTITAVLLIGAVFQRIGIATPFKILAGLGGLFYATYAILTTSFFAADWLNTSTSAGNIASGVICLIGLCVGSFLSLKARQKMMSSPEGTEAKLPEFPMGLIFTFAACGLLTWGGTENLTDILQGRVPGIMSAKLALVLPLLTGAVIWHAKLLKASKPEPLESGMAKQTTV